MSTNAGVIYCASFRNMKMNVELTQYSTKNDQKYETNQIKVNANKWRE